MAPAFEAAATRYHWPVRPSTASVNAISRHSFLLATPPNPGGKGLGNGRAGTACYDRLHPPTVSTNNVPSVCHRYTTHTLRAHRLTRTDSRQLPPSSVVWLNFAIVPDVPGLSPIPSPSNWARAAKAMTAEITQRKPYPLHGTFNSFCDAPKIIQTFVQAFPWGVFGADTGCYYWLSTGKYHIFLLQNRSISQKSWIITLPPACSGVPTSSVVNKIIRDAQCWNSNSIEGFYRNWVPLFHGTSGMGAADVWRFKITMLITQHCSLPVV